MRNREWNKNKITKHKIMKKREVGLNNKNINEFGIINRPEL